MIAAFTRQFVADLHDFRKSLRHSGLKPTIARIFRPDAPASWQSIKYLMIGLLSIVVFYAAYGSFRFGVEMIRPGAFVRERLLWNMLGILLSFVPTNWFAYHTNKRWVFVAGKHEPDREFLLFTIVAGASLLGSQLAVWLLIQYSHFNDLIVTLIVIVLSTLINYLFRKIRNLPSLTELACN